MVLPLCLKTNTPSQCLQHLIVHSQTSHHLRDESSGAVHDNIRRRISCKPAQRHLCSRDQHQGVHQTLFNGYGRHASGLVHPVEITQCMHASLTFFIEAASCKPCCTFGVLLTRMALTGDPNTQRWSQYGDPICAAAHSPLQCQRLPRCGGRGMVRLPGNNFWAKACATYTAKPPLHCFTLIGLC